MPPRLNVNSRHPFVGNTFCRLFLENWSAHQHNRIDACIKISKSSKKLVKWRVKFIIIIAVMVMIVINNFLFLSIKKAPDCFGKKLFFLICLAVVVWFHNGLGRKPKGSKKERKRERESQSWQSCLYGWEMTYSAEIKFILLVKRSLGFHLPVFFFF